MSGSEDGYPAFLMGVDACSADNDDFTVSVTVQVGWQDGQDPSLGDQVFGGKEITALTGSMQEAYTDKDYQQKGINAAKAMQMIAAVSAPMTMA